MTSTLAAPTAGTTARLRTLLGADAAFCAVLGLPAAVAAGPVADLLGPDVSTTVVRVVGIALVLYALDLAVTSRLADRWQRRAVLGAAIGNVAWVLAAVVLVALGAFSTTGAVVALIAALVAGELAVLQLRAARH